MIGEIVLIGIRADELSVLHAKRHADRIFDFKPGRIVLGFGFDESYVPITDKSTLLCFRGVKENWQEYNRKYESSHVTSH